MTQPETNKPSLYQRIATLRTHIAAALPAKLSAKFSTGNTVTRSTSEFHVPLELRVRDPTVLYTGEPMPEGWQAAALGEQLPNYVGAGTRTNPLTQVSRGVFAADVAIPSELAGHDDFAYMRWLEQHASRGYDRKHCIEEP